MPKQRKNIFLPSIFMALMLLTNTLGCAREGVLYLENQFWNPDSSLSFTYKEYSLGISGGYGTIEVKCQEILRFDFAVVYGGWENNETIKIVSSDPPKKINLEGIDLKFIVVQAESVKDYINLKNLAQ